MLLAVSACGDKETLSVWCKYGTQYKAEKSTTAIAPYAIETLRTITSRREKQLCLKHFDDNFCSYQSSRMLDITEKQAHKGSMAFAEHTKAEKISSRSLTRLIPTLKT